MRKNIVLLLASLMMVSCEFFEIDEVGVEAAAKMHLPQDTIYVMHGDTFSLNPVFDPDTININDLFILPANNNVVAVCGGDKLEAVGVGGTKLYITSVSARIVDSCMVYVTESWDVERRVWPYETVFYANVTFDGQPLPDNMDVAAFVNGQCRAIGVKKQYAGISMTLLRVGSNFFYGNETNWDNAGDVVAEVDEEGFDDEEGGGEEETVEDEEGIGSDDEEDPYIYRERITFMCYDHTLRQLYVCPTRVVFDGETHGTPSNLYQIAFSR